jgi:hypothetical protein
MIPLEGLFHNHPEHDTQKDTDFRQFKEVQACLGTIEDG